MKKEYLTQWRHAKHQRGFVVFRDEASEACVRAVFPESFAKVLRDRSGDAYSRGATTVARYGQNNAEVRVRLYRRGGMLRRLVATAFLGSLAESRLVQELLILQYCREHEVPVPQPVGGYVEYLLPGLIYRCAIAMAEIPGAKSVLEIFQQDQSGRAEIRELSTAAAELIERLIAIGVYHCDLHPGNMLVSADGSLVVIDFDKAVFVEEANRDTLSAAYSSRWARGCRKHLDEAKAREAIASFTLRPKQYVSNG